jgi:hypothetical protein
VVRAHAWRGVPADHRSRRLPFPLTRLASISPGYRTSPNRLSSTFPSLPIFLLVTNHISLLEGEALSLGPNFFFMHHSRDPSGGSREPIASKALREHKILLSWHRQQRLQFYQPINTHVALRFYYRSTWNTLPSHLSAVTSHR